MSAEKQRSLSLQNSMQRMAETQAKEVERGLVEAQNREQSLREEVENIRKANLALKAQSGCSPERVQELESGNFLLREQIKSLEEQLEDIKQSAVTPS